MQTRWTTPAAACLLGVPEHLVRKLLAKGVVTASESAGRLKLFDLDAMKRLHEALVDGGHLKSKEQLAAEREAAGVA